jgi:hypothetical protein
MSARITLIIEWEKSEGANGDVKLEDVFDVADYIEGTVESNAQFDGLEIAVKDTLVEEF